MAIFKGFLAHDKEEAIKTFVVVEGYNRLGPFRGQNDTSYDNF